MEIKKIYCFDTRLPWDYSKQEMEISKMNGIGIQYDSTLKKFIDFEGNAVDIKDKLIFPRTGVAQLCDMNNEIINQGGIPIVSNEQIEQIESWPNYYFDERKSKIIKGHDLIDINTIKKIKDLYGEEIFIKTKSKNFSGIIPIKLLLDEKCAFHKTLLYHLEDDFIISKKVDILEDEYGKKEYRCFVIDNKIYNISRFTTSVLHTINFKILDQAQKIIERLKDVFPSCYVLDLFEYQLDGKNYIDVVEFNPINSSGLYLYNSCMKKSDDLLHSNIKEIAYEFINKIGECTTEGKVFNDRSNLYDIPNSFSSHLRSICLIGRKGTIFSEYINFSENDFARHDPIYDFSSATELEEETLIEPDESDLLTDLPSELTEKIKKLLRENKF